MNIRKILQSYKALSLQAKLCFIIFNFFTTFIIAQNNNYLNEVTVNTPNAASLGKYGDIPVSNHSGVPNISIPIHTISGMGGVSVPVTLSYHASGVKVVETPSWVGSNWTLNAGGAITRSVRNAPDEGLFATGIRGIGWYETSAAAIEAQLIAENTAYLEDGFVIAGIESQNMAQGKWDTEPDAFTFNVGGYSGKFYLKPGQQQVVMVSASSDVKILCHFNTANKSFDYWTMITPDGIKYTFGQPNTNEFLGHDLAVDLTNNYISGNAIENNLVVNAWYLTKIESADSKHSITLNYAKERYRYINRGSDKTEAGTSQIQANTTNLSSNIIFISGNAENRLYNYVFSTHVVNMIETQPSNMPPPLISKPSQRDRLVHTEVYGARLESIVGDYEVIDFVTQNSDRKDLDNTTDIFNAKFTPNINTVSRARALDRIILKTKSLEQVKEQAIAFKIVKLTTDYFVSNTTGFPTDWSVDDFQSDLYRLRLKKVVEYDAALTDATKKEYVLSYINTEGSTVADGVRTNLPRRKATAVDVWGYYNGKNNNAGLLPYGEIYSNSTLDYGQGENLEFNTTFGEIREQLKTQIADFDTDAYPAIGSKIFDWFNTNSGYKVKSIGDIYSGNRAASFPHGQEGTLNRIDYPTGGYTLFEYEPHQYKTKVEKLTLHPLFNYYGLSAPILAKKTCSAPTSGPSCPKYIRLENIYLNQGVPLNKARYAIVVARGDVNDVSEFAVECRIKKDNILVNTLTYSLASTEKKKVFSELLSHLLNNVSITPSNRIDIEVYSAPIKLDKK